MAWHATTRLTLTKSRAEEKPVVEAGEPFPESSLYSDADMKRLEAEGYVRWVGKAVPPAKTPAAEPQSE